MKAKVPDLPHSSHGLELHLLFWKAVSLKVPSPEGTQAWETGVPTTWVSGPAADLVQPQLVNKPSRHLSQPHT